MKTTGFGLGGQIKGQLDTAPIRVSDEQRRSAIRTIGAYAPKEQQWDLLQILGLDDEFRP